MKERPKARAQKIEDILILRHGDHLVLKDESGNVLAEGKLMGRPWAGPGSSGSSGVCNTITLESVVIGRAHRRTPNGQEDFRVVGTNPKVVIYRITSAR